MLPKVCIICCRFTSESKNFAHANTNDEETDETNHVAEHETETLRRFFHLLERYLNDSRFCSDEAIELFPLENLINGGGMLSCGECSKIVEGFCDLYHQMKSIELALNWKVKSLKNVMLGAQRMPIRMKRFREIVKQLEIGDVSPDEIMDFKEDLIKKCRRKLQTSFPRLKLKKCKQWNTAPHNSNTCDEDNFNQIPTELDNDHQPHNSISDATIKEDIEYVMATSTVDMEFDDAGGDEASSNKIVVETNPEIFIPTQMNTHKMVEHATHDQDVIVDCPSITRPVTTTIPQEGPTQQHLHGSGSALLNNLNEAVDPDECESNSLVHRDRGNDLLRNLQESSILNGNISWIHLNSDMNHPSLCNEDDVPVEEIEIGDVKVVPPPVIKHLTVDFKERNQPLTPKCSDVLCKGELINYDYSKIPGNESKHLQIEEVIPSSYKDSDIATDVSSPNMDLQIGQHQLEKYQNVSIATEIRETLPLSIIAPTSQSPDQSGDLPITTNPINGRYQCGICFKEFKYKNGVNRHSEKWHWNVRYKCTLCDDKTFSHRDQFTYHHRSEHLGVRYRCNICYEMFKRPYLLKKHFQLKHSGDEFLKNHEALDQSSFQTHQITNEPNVEAGMQAPEEDSANKARALLPVATENIILNYLLSQPPQYSANPSNLTTNLSSTGAAGPRDWACELCGINFMFKTSLQYHMQAYHGRASP